MDHQDQPNCQELLACQKEGNGCSPEGQCSSRARRRETKRGGGTPKKGDNPPAAPPVNQKGTVNEVMDEEDVQDTNYDTDDLANLPTDSDAEDDNDDPSGLDPDSEGEPQ